MAVHRKRRPGEKKLPPLSGSGWSVPKPKKLSPSQLKKVRAGEAIYITIRGQKKRVTKANLKGDNIYWYLRGKGRKKVCLRNFARDRAYPARHKAIRGKPFTGD